MWLLNSRGASIMTPTKEQIQERAFYLWEQRGRPDGSPEVDWERAERELLEHEEPKYTASWSRPAPDVSVPTTRSSDTATKGQDVR